MAHFRLTSVTITRNKRTLIKNRTQGSNLPTKTQITHSNKTEDSTRITFTMKNRPIKASKGLPTKASKGLPTKASKGLPTKALKGLPTKALKGLPTKLPKGLPTKLPKGLKTKASKGLKTKASKGLKTKASKGLKTKASKGLKTKALKGPPIKPPKNPIPKASNKIRTVSPKKAKTPNRIILNKRKKKRTYLISRWSEEASLTVTNLPPLKSKRNLKAESIWFQCSILYIHH